MREVIEKAAIEVAKKGGLYLITHREVSKEAGCSPSLVPYYMGDVNELRDWIVNHAIANEILDIVAEAIVCKHHLTEELDPDLRKAALDSI